MSGKTLHGLIRGEEGQSLVVALVLVSALTISIAGIITFTTSNERSFGRDRVSDRALAAAEAGLANGVSRVQQGDPNDLVNTLASGTVPNVDGSTVSYTVTKNTATPGAHYWTVRSTATYRGITRQVEQRVDYTSATTTVDVSGDYDYGLFIGTPPVGTNPACLITLAGNVNVNANVWIGGNLCTNGGTSLAPNVAHTLSVYVKGYVTANGGGSIGTSALPFDTANIVGGCSSGTYQICSSSTNVWADHYGAAISTLQKPTVDAAGTYALANWSSAACTGSAGFVLDDNTAMDRSVNATQHPNGPQELFPNNKDYSCVVTYPDGYKTTMAWNSSTATFSLNTNDPTKNDAIVFVDGDLTMTKPGGSSTVNWTGNGSIYVNGTVSKGSNFNVCGPPGTPNVASGFGCAGSWDSTLGNVGMVILNPQNATYGFDSAGNGEVDFSMLIAKGINNTGGTVVTGSVLADGGSINGGTGFFRPGVVTSGFPTHATKTTAVWNLHPGSWKQLK